MCGRYTTTFPSFLLIVERFNIDGNHPSEYKPSYNIAPTQDALVIIPEKGKKSAQYFRWGLIPYWARDKDMGSGLINARAETISEKPSFRRAFQQRRALVPADGFYEWKKEKGKKIPYWFHLQNRGIFAFAGIWEEWKDHEGRHMRTFSIITTEANSKVKTVHGRMPVILKPDAEKTWLNPEANAKDLKETLRPYPPKEMEFKKVSTAVNSPANNHPGLIEEEK